MKSIQISLFALLSIVIISCEKLSLPEDASKPKGNLTLTVNQLDQIPFDASTRAVASDVCTRLNFAIYNTEGVRIKQINQKVGDSEFGIASFQLNPGTYQIVALAHSSSGNPTMTNPAKIQFTNANGYTDTFLYSNEISIDEDPIMLSLTLNRIVALCRFIINDAIPSDVAKLDFEYTGGSGAFDAATGLGCVKSTQRMNIESPQGQNQFDLYTFLHDLMGTIHLKVTAKDIDENEIQKREFDIPLQTNQITRFTGTFFSGESIPTSRSTDVSVTINTKWSGETTLTY